MRSSENWTILAGLWTIKLGRQNGRLLHWRKCSCVSTKTKHWKLLLQTAVRTSSWLFSGPPECLTFSYCASLCMVSNNISIIWFTIQKRYRLVLFSSFLKCCLNIEDYNRSWPCDTLKCRMILFLKWKIQECDTCESLFLFNYRKTSQFTRFGQFLFHEHFNDKRIM